MKTIQICLFFCNFNFPKFVYNFLCRKIVKTIWIRTFVLTTLISRKNADFSNGKNSWKWCGFAHFVVDNFDFPRKMWIFKWKNFVKTIRICTIQLMTTLISREKSKKIIRENDAMISRKKLRKINRENDSICILKLLTTLISRNKIVDFSNGKKPWKWWGFAHFCCWQLWFPGIKLWIFQMEKTVKMMRLWI